MSMYLDLHKVPTFVMLGKRTFIINDVEEARKKRCWWWWHGPVKIELKHGRIGCHWSPLQSSKPPSTNALPIAQSSRCTVPQTHLYFPMHSKKASHRTWARGWGQSQNWLDCSPRCMKDIFLPPSSQLLDKIRHDMIELRFFGSSFFRLHEYYAKYSSWQILHNPLAGTSLWEKNLSRYKMSITHSYQNCSWFIVTTSRR